MGNGKGRKKRQHVRATQHEREARNMIRLTNRDQCFRNVMRNRGEHCVAWNGTMTGDHKSRATAWTRLENLPCNTRLYHLIDGDYFIDWDEMSFNPDDYPGFDEFGFLPVAGWGLHCPREFVLEFDQQMRDRAALDGSEPYCWFDRFVSFLSFVERRFSHVRSDEIAAE